MIKAKNKKNISKTVIQSKNKKYADFKQSIPSQLEMFHLPEIHRGGYSNTVELYDVMPKYYHGGVTRVGGKFLDKLSRSFQHRGKSLKLNITPALITTNKGENKAFYPGQREEIIEDVLRKFMAEGRGKMFDNQVGVIFSLYELKKELDNREHGYAINEIKESLDILGSTVMEITSEDGTTSLKSTMFETVGFTSENDGDNRKYFVRFNSLVTKSVMEQSWRLVNYDQCMQYKRAVARWLHKRMSHLFLQATLEQPYIILLSTIIRDSGMKEYKQTGDSIIQIKKSLDEMKSVGTLEKYKIEKIFSKNRKNKIDDAKFFIYVSALFVKDIKKGHFLLKQLKQETAQAALASSKEEIKDITVSNIELNTAPLKQKLEQLNLATRYINSVLKRIENQKDLENTLESIKAAEEYIDNHKDKKQLSVIAIIKSAIKEEWRSIQKSQPDSKNEKIEVIDNLIKTKEGRSLKPKLIKTFGEDTYNSWFAKLNVSIDTKTKTIIFEATNTFSRDYIEKEYLLNTYAKDKSTVRKKGIEYVCKEVFPKTSKIKIISKK